MAFVRVYTGEDGNSHFEDMTLESHPFLAEMTTATGVQFRSQEPGYFSDWHNAPRRQYVITLAGEAEIGIQDGTLRRFGPGDVLLADDTTGKGHSTRVTSSDKRYSVFIPIPGD